MGVQEASGIKTGALLLKTGHGLLGGVLSLTDGSNACTITVYDNDNVNPQENTKVIWKNTDAAANNYGGGFFVHPLEFEKGCLIVPSGSGVPSFIAYEFIQ